MSRHMEVRKVQTMGAGNSLFFVLPKTYADELGIVKGDLLKIIKEGKRLVVEKLT
jgi:antitoxin component of MazEF toxin-antitoxin module